MPAKTRIRRLVLSGACALPLIAVSPDTVLAQGPLPSEPISIAEGRLVLGGEVLVSTAADDQPGYFNYTDYASSALRLFRASLQAAWRPAKRLAVLGELRSDNWDGLTPAALYLRVRPWADRAFDIQAGRIPPVFGAFARRGYGTDTLLIGYPLAYQYLTTLRPDALPASADDLLRYRGSGWLVRYPLGSAAPAPGVPLVSAFRWDTGVQARIASRLVEVSAALTNGTLANPRVDDDNAGKQLSGRIAFRPTPGLVIGVSGASGQFVSDTAVRALPVSVDPGDLTQRAFGADLEYSQDHWLVRAELVYSSWRLPAIAPPRIDGRLRSVGTWVEGRYRVTPRVYLAARVDRLGFSRITGSRYGGERSTPWDAPVSRVEAGGGYYLRRNVVARAVYQYNWREGGPERRRGLASAQLVYWF